GEIAREIDNASGSILHNLRRILDFDVVTGAVAEKILHRVGAITDDHEKFTYTCIAQSFDDVPQNRFAAHFNHRFGEIDRELTHTSAAPGCQQDCLVDPRHQLVLSTFLPSRR